MHAVDPSAEVIRVLVVEDDEPTRWRIADALAASGGFEVEAAGDLAAARAVLERFRPKVLLTDLKLPDGHGTELIRAVRRALPDTEIMVISILGDETSVVGAIDVGATGYILKDALPADLAATVRDLAAGNSPITPTVARFIVRRAHAAGKAPGAGEERAHLTPRELDILWGIAKGFTYNDIADRLAISRNTVPTHIKSIYRKLEVTTRGEAVFEAVQQGLIRL